MSHKSTLFVVAFVTGLLTGGAAALLKNVISWISHSLTDGMSTTGGNYILLAIPVMGILLTGIYVRYILRDNIEHGVTHLIANISGHKPMLPPHLIYGPMVASSLTLGFGGSAGSEGPIAYTGAAIGSNVARWLGMPPRIIMIMVGCGAGAGIAGIFKAPVGGILFTLEVLKMEMTTVSVVALIIAALTSAVTAYVLSGCTFDVTWSDNVPFSPDILPWVIALGVFCGLYAFYYALVMKRLGAFYDKISNPWVRNLSSGVLLAVLVFIFPSLYGEGYGVITEIINGNDRALFNDSLFSADTPSVSSLIMITAGVLLVKCWAACSANSGGGVAGDFAPTLFAGAMAGLLFASLADAVTGAHVSTANFAMMGMAAVMAGAIRAPLMAIFLTVEMADSYSFFLPIVIAATISYAIVKALTPGSFYSMAQIRRIKEQSPRQ